MAEFKERIDALAALMEEFRLTEAVLQDGPLRVAFRRHASPTAVAVAPVVAAEPIAEEPPEPLVPATPPAPSGTPVTSPMSGIYYDAPSPSSPPFLKEGDTVVAGQVVGLIEAMKVFNEVPSPVSGVVKALVAESGAVVNVGDTLLRIG